MAEELKSKKSLKICLKCDEFFQDKSFNHTAKFCSTRCSGRFWDRGRRKEAKHRERKLSSA